VSTAFTEHEIKYLTAWAIEDHLGKKDAAARTLQRRNGLHSAVLGGLVARMALSLRINEMDMVEGPYPEGPIDWPWHARSELETRLKEILGENSIRHLEQLGALVLEKSSNDSARIQPR
jgi:hypothetical protein